MGLAGGHAVTLDLLNSNRFRGLFWTQFLGAMNDNFFKNALVILILYRLAGDEGPLLVTAAAGIFILPFFLFSALAGQIADKYEKAALTRRIKLAEIVIMAVGGIMLWTGSVTGLMIVLFAMGTQSTMFGPIKYGVIPQLVGNERLMDANALIEMGTFLAILFGTIFGGILILKTGGIAIVMTGMLAMAGLGYAASRLIPATERAAPDLKINPNIAHESWRVVRAVFAQRHMWLAALGISWFWFVGAVYLAQVPTFTKELIGANEEVVTFFLTLFSVGIGVGSMLAARLTRGRTSTVPVPFGAIGMAIFAIDLFFATRAMPPAGPTLIGVLGFLGSFEGWRITFDLFAIALSGGLFVVPLFAAVQAWAEESRRARVIAAINIINAGFMVASALITLALQSAGFDVAQIFLMIGIANVAVAVYVVRLLPDEALLGLTRVLFRTLYRVETEGRHHLDQAGDRAVIVVNHLSLLDAPIMTAVMYEKPIFAIYTGMAENRWVKPMLRFVEALPVDPSNPMAVKTLTQRVKAGDKLVIFPEGRVSVTGTLMKIYDGPALIADKADAPFIPVRIEGAERTPFSRMNRLQVRRQWFPKIRVTFGPPERLELPKGMVGPARRAHAADRLYDIMCAQRVTTSKLDRTLFEALIDAAENHGRSWSIVEDAQKNKLTYGRLIAGSLALGARLSERTSPGEAVGVLLPNATAMVATFMALQATGRIPAMLNFTAGPRNVLAGCATAGVKTVITARGFIEQGKLEALAEALQDKLEVIWLEDLRDEISKADRIKALFESFRTTKLRAGQKADPTSPAVILFTSGSEGVPKAVALSHRNLLANCAQAASRVEFSRQDKVLNVLPTFHCFGLSTALLLPMIYGVPVFLYPSPLHYRVIPEIAYGINATVMFGTDTFYTGYAKRAHPYDFRSLRLVVGGAERLKDETRRIWMEKFGVRILEGYGLTESAPVVAISSAMHNRGGKVGRFVPLLEHRLEPVEGIQDGGRLFLKGPNIMLGYLNAETPGEYTGLDDGWYDTGDIVEIDEDGFVEIKGRAKRFAKIAGEMVSLAAIESMVSDGWPEDMHVAVNLPDPRKGERIVLLTTSKELDRGDLGAEMRRRGATELMVPAEIVSVETMPLLATGKVDMPGCRNLVSDRTSPAVAAAS